MKVSKISVFVIGSMWAVSGFAGSVIQVETTERRSEAPVLGAVELSTSGPMTRIDITSVSEGESGSMIFNSDTRQLIVVDHERKQYYLIDQAQMDSLAIQVSDARRQMEEALEAMPREQRALARQMMQLPEPAPEPPESTLTKTGESDDIAGHDCDYYDVMQEDRRIRDVCITPWHEIPGGQGAASALVELGDFFENMRKAFSETGGTSLIDRQQDLFGYMDELDGYPVLSRDYGDDGVAEFESRVISSKETDIDPAVFAMPEGYQQQSLM